MASRINLTGQTFGKLLAIEEVDRDQKFKDRQARWRCVCVCGRERVVASYSLRSGATVSCGCARKKQRARPGWRPHNLNNRVGEQFGMLTVLAKAPSSWNEASWICRCVCGVEKVVRTSHLRNGNTRSCGCRQGGPMGVGSRPHYKTSMPPGHAARRGLLADYQTAARNRSLEWALSDDAFFDLTKSLCFYCGTPPARVRRVSRNGEYLFNGVDRVDNLKGYVSDNVVPCCATCNHAKCQMSVTDFRSWVRRVAQHLGLTLTA